MCSAADLQNETQLLVSVSVEGNPVKVIVNDTIELHDREGNITLS